MKQASPHAGTSDKDILSIKLGKLQTFKYIRCSGITKPNVAFLIAINKLDLFSRAFQISKPQLNWPRRRCLILMMYDKTSISK